MNMPGFTAEQSLGPTTGMYRGKGVLANFLPANIVAALHAWCDKEDVFGGIAITCCVEHGNWMHCCFSGPGGSFCA